MDDKVDEAKQIKLHNGLFLIACARGLLSEAQQLLDMGALAGTQDKGGLSGAHFAAAHGKQDVLSFLWSKGVELDGEDPGGRSPLHLAALCGHPKCVGMLLGKGAWIDAFDAADNAALHLAARAGQLEAVEALLAGKAKTHVRNKRGLTPLGEAVASGHLHVAQALAAGGAATGDRPRGYSLLHVAAGADQPGTVKWLLHGGDPVDDADNEEAVTPLHCAALAGSVQCARLLVDSGAGKAPRDKAGRRPADLVPAASPTAKVLLTLLGGAVPSQPPEPAAQQQSAAMPRKSASPASPAEAFLAMNERDQMRRALRWAEDIPDESAATAAALGAFHPEVRERVVQAANTGASINIYKALAALHTDEDFQQDLLRLPIQRIIDDTKQHSENYDKHIQNPDVARVLDKIRRFHAVVKANGGTTVDLVQMAAGNIDTVAARDKHKLAELASAHTAQLQAACAAANASTKGEAAAISAANKAYNAEFKAFRHGAVTPGATSSILDGAPRIVPIDHANAAADIAALANKSPLSWESFRREATRQGVQLLMMLVVALVTKFFLGLGPFAAGGIFGGSSSSSNPTPFSSQQQQPADLGHPEL